MNNIIKHIAFPMLMLLVIKASPLLGQVSDTLSMAKSLRDQGKLRESMRILGAYQKNHPDDLFANWIYAQVAYQARHYNLSVSLYKQAVRLFPDENALRLDYAKCLMNTAEFGKADEQLKQLTAKDISNPEPWYYFARIAYWKGENKNALALLDNLLRNIPEYMPALLLRDQIRRDQSPWLSLDVSYATDDQPMKMLNPVLNGGWYRSNFMGLDFQIRYPVSFLDSGNFNALGISLGNKFHFKGPNMNIYLNLGLFRHATLHSTGWTADLKIEKVIFRKFSVWAEMQRKPYLSTLSSLKVPLFENHLTIAANLNDPDHLNGRISFEGSTFSSDHNYITAFCGWMFAPVVKTGRFDFHFGYGYNFSTSKESRFINEKTLSDILSGWHTAIPVSGMYNPYFTPNDQQIHSLLAIINFRAAKTLSFSVNFNGGFYATTRYPFLYLDKNISDSIIVGRDFEKKNFFPVSVDAGMNWQMFKTLDFLARFNYNSTIYYTTTTFAITIRKQF